MCDPLGTKSDKSQSLISSGAHLSRARVSRAGTKGEAHSILSIDCSKVLGSLLGLLLRRALEVNSLLIAVGVRCPTCAVPLLSLGTQALLGVSGLTGRRHLYLCTHSDGYPF